MCVRVCTCVCVHVFMCACVYTRVRECTCVSHRACVSPTVFVGVFKFSSFPSLVNFSSSKYFLSRSSPLLNLGHNMAARDSAICYVSLSSQRALSGTPGCQTRYNSTELGYARGV